MNSNLDEISKIKKQIENEDRIFEKELPTKYMILEKFDVQQLQSLCQSMLGREPPIEYFKEAETGRRLELPRYREDYVYFIIEELRLSEIMDYALAKKIISK